MGKWFGWLGIALVIVMGTVYWRPAGATETKPVAAQLLHALEDSGATGSQIQVRVRTALGQAESPEEVKALAQTWAKQLEIPFSRAEISQKNNLLLFHSTHVQDGVLIGLDVSAVSQNGSFDTYLVLQISGNRQSLQYIETIQETYSKALRKANLIPQISTCIRGMYSVKMSVDQQGGKILSIFQTLRAKELERLQDETVVSVSGFTSMWEPFIALNGQKMNVQVATHRDSDAGTWITVGTPIITVEY